jgi:hypothetical protein
MTYAVTTTENNKVRIFVQGYQEKTDRVWQVVDTYTTGTGFVGSPLDLPCSEERDWALDIVYGNPTLGDLVSTQFVYMGNFTSAEKELIEWSWERSRSAPALELTMMFAGRGWEISIPKMLVPGPFHIEKVNQPQIG